MKLDKLEAGQTYTNSQGNLVTLDSNKLFYDKNRVLKTGATFSIGSDFGFYYGDGPLMGKYIAFYRTVENMGKDLMDLVLPDFEESTQLTLFD